MVVLGLSGQPPYNLSERTGSAFTLPAANKKVLRTAPYCRFFFRSSLWWLYLFIACPHFAVPTKNKRVACRLSCGFSAYGRQEKPSPAKARPFTAANSTAVSRAQYPAGCVAAGQEPDAAQHTARASIVVYFRACRLGCWCNHSTGTKPGSLPTRYNGRCFAAGALLPSGVHVNQLQQTDDQRRCTM